ncbi:MAG: hypothetical protein BWY89_01160 [Bacteroidetes bacterium ADurb.BinA012]|nr:MAG: hypothetical protein BWY89_01160 [Bacteroidetes bacterium ADurb.BinA012]
MKIFSIIDEGIRSNEKDLVSGSRLGAVALLSQTLLYLDESPLTTMNLSSTMDTPGSLLTTSEASLSCVRLISWAEIPETTTGLLLMLLITDTSLSVRLVATTTISSSSTDWSYMAASMTVTEPALTSTPSTFSGLYDIKVKLRL